MNARHGATILVVLALSVFGYAADRPQKALPSDEVNPRISSSLQLVSRAARTGELSPEAAAPAAREVAQTGTVTFIVEPRFGDVDSVDVHAIRYLGGEVEALSESLLRVRAPADRLEAVAEEVSGIAFIREPFPVMPMAITSQGVSLAGADLFHAAGHDGAGARVAIIDLGFSGLTQAQANGELTNVVFTRDYTGLGLETGESHGTGVAEIVEDMAPGASLYLMKISDSVDLQNAVADCIAQGVDVINHSVGWYNSNYYDGTGMIAGIANDARSNGILWVNSAGNEAGDGHWQGEFYGVFPDSDGDGLLNFGSSSGNDFVDADGWDEGNRIDLARDDTLVIYMTWDDWTTSDQDYDLHLYNSSGEIVASSTNWQTGFQAPTETIYYTPSNDTAHTYTDGEYEVVIHAYDAPGAPDIEFYAYRVSYADTNLEYHDASSTIVTPANSGEVLTVGAIRWTYWPTGPQEPFSSQGPSNNSQYASARTKPDIAGPDGVSNWTYGFFYGTSASSPHVAGAAALLLDEDPSRTADDLQALLEGSAIDMGTSGKDDIYGAGRLNLELSSTPPSPPAQVADFAASDGEDGQSTLTWTNPSDFDLAQVVVQRTIGGYATDHTDGVTVYDNASPVPGGAVSTVDDGLTDGMTYFYAVFGRDADGAWNETVTEGSNADTALPAGSPPPPSGAAGYWQFNEGAGTTASDSSGNGNDGAIVGASWITSVDGSGALSFDGVGDYVAVPDAASLDIASAITVEAWIRLDDASVRQRIVSCDGPGGGNNFYTLMVNGGRLQFYVYTTLWRLAAGTSALPTGEWLHVAGVYTGTQVQVYVNGVLDGQGAASGAVGQGQAGQSIVIGAKAGASDVVRGDLDEVRITPEALSEFNLLPGGPPPPPPSPPAQVADFAATDGENEQSTLTWTNPSDVDLAQVVVQRKTGGYPGDHADGETIYDNSNPVPGDSISAVNGGLANGTTYYYAVFGRDVDGSWNDAVTEGSNADTASPVAPVPSPPAQVADFVASDGEDGQSTLTWTNPSDADLAQVLVQRKIGGYPADHTDGVTVYENASPVPGGAVSPVDDALANGTTYYYAVFGRDVDGSWNDTVTEGSNADTASPVGSPPPPSDAAGYWQFNEGAGTTAGDSSGNGNDGTIVGASWITSVDGSGALSFDGVDDYVTVPDAASLDIGSAITVEAWIRLDDASVRQRVVSCDGPGGGNNFYTLMVNGGRLQFYVFTTLWSLAAGTSALPTGEWIHVAGVYTGTQVQVYVNGVLDGQGSASGAVGQGQAGQPVVIGAKAGASDVVRGDLDEVRIASEALTEFNLLPGGPPPPPPSPPAQVADFAASDGEDGQSTLTWTNPSDADLAQVLVQRKIGGYPVDHTDGVTVYDNASPVPGGAVSPVDDALTNGTTYFYAVFGRDADGSWNDTVTEGSNADTASPVGSPPPPSDAAGYWQFNEGAGTTAGDSSGNGNDGTIVGASWITSVDGSGALSFDGVDDYVTVPDAASLDIASAITVEAWIRLDDASVRQRIVSCDGPGGGNNFYTLMVNGGRLQFYVFTTLWSLAAGTSALPTGEWIHVAGVYTGTEVQVYVNGVLDGQGAASGAVGQGQAGQPVVIGAKAGASDVLRGDLDEVKITAQALTEFGLLPTQQVALSHDQGESSPRFVAFPNPAQGDHVRFEVRGYDADEVRILIYGLDGSPVYDTGWLAGQGTEWDLRRDDGTDMANGPLLWVMQAQLAGGSLVTSGAHVLFVHH